MEKMCIRCQVTVCPYGKQCGQRCIFGELYTGGLSSGTEIREHHKCPRAKEGNLQYVDVVLKIA